jgi:hypothetical protein
VALQASINDGSNMESLDFDIENSPLIMSGFN